MAAGLSEKWIQRMMELALLVASWSKDPNTRVGAVITQGNRVVSLGYNGFPRTVEDTPQRLQDRDTRLKFTLHAEMNAILQAREPLQGYNLITTHHPCTQCAQAIVQSGIARVYYLSRLGRWEEDTAEEIFLEAGVQLQQVSLNKPYGLE